MASRKKKAGSKRTARKRAPATGKRTSATRHRATAGRGGTGAASGTRRKSGEPPPGAFPEVEALVDLMDRHGLLEVDLETGAEGTRRIRVSRGGGAAAHPAASASTAPTPSAASATAPADATPAAASAAGSEGLHAFKSPMVGTFYRAPSPESPPFVSVGDHVDTGTTVCIIEAMKVMNEIVPDSSGEIASIEVENGEAVEYGQTLFLIRSA